MILETYLNESLFNKNKQMYIFSSNKLNSKINLNKIPSFNSKNKLYKYIENKNDIDKRFYLYTYSIDKKEYKNKLIKNNNEIYLNCSVKINYLDEFIITKDDVIYRSNINQTAKSYALYKRDYEELNGIIDDDLQLLPWINNLNKLPNDWKKEFNNYYNKYKKVGNL